MAINFDDIHWTESKIDKIEVDGRSITLHIHNSGVAGISSARAVIVRFTAIRASRGTVFEYGDDGLTVNDEIDSYVVEDIPVSIDIRG